jgi:hypothetical protein
VTYRGKHSSLLRRGINYSRKKLYLKVALAGACTIKLFTAVIYEFS